MSNRAGNYTAAAAEVVFEPAHDEVVEAQARNKIARYALRLIYVETSTLDGLGVNAGAQEALDDGKHSFHLMPVEGILRQFELIEKMLEQSKGKTRGAKMAALFGEKDIFGVVPSALYAQTIERFGDALKSSDRIIAEQAAIAKEYTELLGQRPSDRRKKQIQAVLARLEIL